MKLFKLIAASLLSMGFLSMAVMADEPKDKVKAGFVYIGPTGDHGWTYRHDIGRQDVAEAFNVGKAKAVVVCISDRDQANRAVIALCRFYPDVKIFSRARDRDHADRLQSTLNVAAMVPILPEDNFLETPDYGNGPGKTVPVFARPMNSNSKLELKVVLDI